MTIEEFSNEFDVLLNSYATQFSEGLVPNLLEFDEYEKSVFLTKAQEEIVLELYNGTNPKRTSFEEDEENRRHLNPLIKTSIIKEKGSGIPLTPNSFFFRLPPDLWFITYETAYLQDTGLGCYNEKEVSVTPVTQDTLESIRSNPFRRDNKKRVLRLDIEGNIVELISKYNISYYKVRYLAKPTPIILQDLPKTLSINKIQQQTECKLPPTLHKTILERAIRLALISKSLLSRDNTKG